MTRKIDTLLPPMMLLSAVSRAGCPSTPLEIPSPRKLKASQLLLACHMLKDWNEREHCIVFGLQGAWWGGESGDTVPKATSSCLAEFGKEGGEGSCLRLEE